MKKKTILQIVNEHKKTEPYTAIIDALNKQIPKKVGVKYLVHKELIAYDSYRYIVKKIYNCPFCDAMVFTQNYCDNCGQKLNFGSH